MIDFKHVNRRSLRYSLLYQYVRFVHNHIYYRNYTVVNAKNLPKDEGFMVICDHQNGLNDALGILFSLGGRFPVFIARGDIFKKEFIAKMLRFLRIMPAFRKRDVGIAGLEGNEEIFKQSARIIKEGDVLALFPEAGHQDKRYLGTFKKGFARIAFRAVELSDYQMKLKIVPMGNHYTNYFHMQGKLMINIGEPFDFTELYELHKKDPYRAKYLLAQKAREKVKPLMLDIEDSENYEAYEMLCIMYRDNYIQQKGWNKRYFPNELKADQDIVKKLDELKGAQAEVFEQIAKDALEYKGYLNDLKLRDWIFRKRFLSGFITRFFLLLLFAPIWLFGWLNNFIPFYAGDLINKKIKDNMLHSSIHFGLGVLVTFPLWYLILFISAWIFSANGWIALAYFCCLPISLLVYFRSKVLSIKLYNRTKRFFLKLRKNPILQQAEDLRENIIASMDKIMA